MIEIYFSTALIVAIIYFILPISPAVMNIGLSILSGLFWPLSLLFILWITFSIIFAHIITFFQKYKT